MMELRGLADDVRARVAESVRRGTGADLRHLVGVQEMVAELRRVEPLARRTCRVMQPQYFYDPEDPGVQLTRVARARGVPTELITRPRTVETHPLLPSIFPNTLLGPVFLRSMVVDGELAIVEGLDTAAGDRTSWATSRPEIVESLVALWDRTVPLCAPILPPGTPPPLTERQLEIARLIAVGEKDQTIARLLHLSERTVEREVGRVLRELGARSRAEAVLLMRGRGVNGGLPPRG